MRIQTRTKVTFSPDNVCYCKDDKSVLNSINNNKQIICLDRILFKGRRREWDDYFTSLLDSYKQRHDSFYIQHKMLCGRIINVMISNTYIIYVKEIFTYESHKAEISNSVNRYKFDHSCFNNPHHYFKNLLYDSVSLSYHTNIHNRKLTLI